MKKFFSTILIAAALPFMVGCSDSDDSLTAPNAEKVATAPEWAINLPMPDGDMMGMPDWEEVNFFDSRYEKGMTAIIKIQKFLQPHFGDKDLMAAIIDGEVRELAYPVDYDDSTKAFMLYIPFSSGEDKVEIQYYNAENNQTFFYQEAFSVLDDTVGSESDFEIVFYVMMNLNVILDNKLPFPPSPDDQVAAFYEDGSCCGVGTKTDDNTWKVEVYGDEVDRPIACLRYYSASLQTVYTMKTDIPFRQETTKSVIFEF